MEFSTGTPRAWQPGFVARAEEIMGLGKIVAVSVCGALLWLGCSAADSDVANPVPATPETLAAPDKGQGFQLATGTFSVPAGTEEQDCYFFKVSDVAAANGLPKDKPVNLHRIQIVQKDGSHHMNIFRVRTIVGLDPANGAVQRGTNGQGQCFKSANWADWPLVANTQQKGDIDWTYPDGVANVFQPDEWLMLQTHFVNAATQKSPDATGAVTANFYTIPPEQVKYELGTLFATDQNIRICASNPTPTFFQSCAINSPEPVTIIGANGHFHARGRKFDMYTWDGSTVGVPPDAQRFYTSSTWDDPPMLRSPSLEVQVPPKGGVFYTCSYQWMPPDPSTGCQALDTYDQAKHPGTTSDCCYSFGPSVDENEHCNAFVYYYPKRDNVSCK